LTGGEIEKLINESHLKRSDLKKTLASKKSKKEETEAHISLYNALTTKNSKQPA
jgi:hypothetical protein